jgi:hypothetical protein
MGFPTLPQLSAAAELFVVNLVAHHNPQPDAWFACRRDPCLAHSFLDELPPIEAFKLRIFLNRMHGRFGPQIAQQGVAFLGQFSQSLSLSAAALTGDHPDIAGHLIAAGKAIRVPEKHLGRQGGYRTHPGMRQQPARLWPLSSLCFYFFVQLLDSPLQLSVQSKQLISSLTGVKWQSQGLQCALPRPTPQAMAVSQGRD